MFYEQKHSAASGYLHLALRPYHDFEFPLHLHESFELICIIEGCMTVQIDGIDFAVPQGHCALILPGQPHALFSPQHNRSWLVIFSSDFLPELHPNRPNAQTHNPIFPLGRADLYERLCEYQNDPFRLKSLLYETAACYADGALFSGFQSENDPLACRIVEYLDAHYTEPLTLQQLAAAFGYNYRYMSGVVNRLFRAPLPTVINNYRVNHACRLLRDSDHSMTEIASLCGFETLRSFNRNFKALTGLTPRAYAKQSK